jgi:hypothetical protein
MYEDYKYYHRYRNQKEKGMNDCVVLKTSDLIKAWDNSCREAKYVLEKLYPDDLPPRPREEECEDVTGGIEFEYYGDYFRIHHNGNKVSIQQNACTVDQRGRLTVVFGVPRCSGGYKFKVTSNRNWQLLKVKE